MVEPTNPSLSVWHNRKSEGVQWCRKHQYWRDVVAHKRVIGKPICLLRLDINATGT